MKVLPVDTTTFKTHEDSVRYTGPLRVLLTTVDAYCVARNCLDNGMVGLGHLRHDGLVFYQLSRRFGVENALLSKSLVAVSLQLGTGRLEDFVTSSRQLMRNSLLVFFSNLPVKFGVFCSFVGELPEHVHFRLTVTIQFLVVTSSRSANKNDPIGRHA